MLSGKTTWLEISKNAAANNLGVFRKITGKGVKLMAVIKSNAYGHGINGLAEICIKNNIDYLGVVNLDEALELRKKFMNVPVLVLSYYDKERIKEAIENNIDLVVYDLETAEYISKTALQSDKKANLHVKIDTGTSRLGILADNAINFIKEVKKLKNIKISGIFTHFSDSENEDWTFTKKQIGEFNNLLFDLQKTGINIPVAHAACSAAALASADTHFNMIRLGIALYGLWPSENNKKAALKRFPDLKLMPVLSWKTKIIQIKELAKGVFVGYGCDYKTKRKTRLAVIPVGYYEGYDRRLSNRGEVLIQGVRARVLGRICMNLTMVDVTDIFEAKVNDEVVLIGKQEKDEITADDLAEKTGTINYEIVSGINPLLPRIYL